MKKLMLICAPVSSRSGYGDHARDLVRAFLKHDKFNIKIWDVPWGETPRNALDINKKSIVAIIPARGGSKGLPKKNIYPILNKSKFS